MQIALVVSKWEGLEVEVIVPGLLMASWPLAVSAIVLALIDIRMAQDRAAVRRHDALGVPEAPVAARASAVAKSAPAVASAAPNDAYSPAHQAHAKQVNGVDATLPDPHALMSASTFSPEPPLPPPPDASVPESAQKTVSLKDLRKNKEASAAHQAAQGASAPSDASNSELSFFKV